MSLASTPRVIETYVGRWNEETTFQEMRCYLGLESTRGWKERTVLRAAPCLFGLYMVEWLGKEGVTFSDSIAA